MRRGERGSLLEVEREASRELSSAEVEPSGRLVTEESLENVVRVNVTWKEQRFLFRYIKDSKRKLNLIGNFDGNNM